MEKRTFWHIFICEFVIFASFVAFGAMPFIKKLTFTGKRINFL